jgi:hypothetical protein
MLSGMSEAGGPGDKAQEIKAQVAQKARHVRAQAIVKAPQLAGAAAQRAQRVVQDKPPGAAVGAGASRTGIVDPPSSTQAGGRLMKMLYKPLSLVVSVLGGILAGAVFKKVWAAVSGEEDVPKATSLEYSTREVLVAAAVQGAIFAGVKAAVDRAGAKGIRRITGADPGR